MSTASEMVTNTNGYSYQAVLAASQKVNWRIEDIIGGDKKLDFSKPFMPESLARVQLLDFLNVDEQRILNQIRGNSYLSIFGVVEEFILPFLMDHARPHLSGDDFRIRALLQFAGEEAKHIHLFKRFREAFKSGFGVDCAVIGPPEAIGKAILAHDPLAVALAILSIEWMTQQHYLEGVKDDQELDPLFASLLKHHWMEESQHAKLDGLVVEAIAEGRSRKQIEDAFAEYLEIGAFIDAGLVSQTQFDLEAFERATGRTFSDSERDRFIEVQRQANRYTYLGSGMIHPNFQAVLQSLLPELKERIQQIAPSFC